MTESKKKAVWGIVVVVLLAAGYFGYPIVRFAIGLEKKGVLDRADDVTYTATTNSNLQAIYAGLKHYQEDEGQFPKSDQWMDAIKNRIQAGNMSESEAAKKLVDPSLGGQAGLYGYAMNDAASEKYIGDLKDKKMPLVFMSSDTAKNAHGDPTKLAPNPPRRGGNYAVTVDGTVIKL